MSRRRPSLEPPPVPPAGQARDGGAIAIVRDGDQVCIDKQAQTLSLLLPDEEIAARLKAWSPPPPKDMGCGVLRKYAKLVSSAHYGAHTG